MTTPTNKEQVFSETVLKLMTAIHQAFAERKAPFPALILLYASIDIISSLCRSQEQEDTSPEVFKRWVDDYLLPDSGLKCTSADIYAARCGILHTLSLNSRSYRKGEARRISYVSEETKIEQFQRSIDPLEKNTIVIDWIKFGQAFFDGVKRFSQDIQKDSELRERVFYHVEALAGVLYLKRDP